MTWQAEIREVAHELSAQPQRWCKFLSAKLVDAANQMSVVDGIDYCGECGQEIVDCPCEHMAIVIGVVSDYLVDLYEMEQEIIRRRTHAERER